MSPRGRAKPKAYRCQDCGASFYDMTKPVPDLHRERLMRRTTAYPITADLERETVTTFYRTTPVVLGTFWLVNYPDSTLPTALCRACGAKRGYVEGGTAGTGSVPGRSEHDPGL